MPGPVAGAANLVTRLTGLAASNRHGERESAESDNGSDFDSRTLIAAIFRWYKILSPHIELGIESVAWDAASHTLFVGLHQRFALWFVPLYAAHVRLVTELQLVPILDGEGSNSYAAVTAGSGSGSGSGSGVAALAPATHTSNTGRGRAVVNGVPGTAPLSQHAQHPPQTRYYIARQEDHYQFNEVAKFLMLGLGAWLWALVQLFTTSLCVGGVLVADTSLALVRGKKKGGKK